MIRNESPMSNPAADTGAIFVTAIEIPAPEQRGWNGTHTDQD